MRTHSREKFCFYTAVDEVQLRLLALDHFAEEDDAAVVDLASLVPDDGIRSGLKAVANRGNSKGSPMLLVSTSRKHLKTCDHKLWRDDKWTARQWAIVQLQTLAVGWSGGRVLGWLCEIRFLFVSCTTSFTRSCTIHTNGYRCINK